MRLSAFTHDILLLFAGPIVWAVHFVGIYALAGIVCARPGSAGRWQGLGWEGWAIVTASMVAVAVLAACWRLRSRSEDAHNRGFLHWMAAALAALAVLAIAWETLSVFLVPGCPQAS
jgi:hypothetical protein